MFGKKSPPPPPPPPFRLHVLTTEFWIEGLMPGDSDLLHPTAEKFWREIMLSDVRLHALYQPESPIQTYSHFALTGKTIVALIPQTDVRLIRNYFYWENYKHPRPGLFHVGPYVMMGKLMFMELNVNNNTLPMTEATITHPAPTAGIPEIQAPFLLINTDWLAGYIPM